MMHGNASWGWGGARKGAGRKPGTPAARRYAARREKVAALRAAGWTQREIARELGLSQGTIVNDQQKIARDIGENEPEPVADKPQHAKPEPVETPDALEPQPAPAKRKPSSLLDNLAAAGLLARNPIRDRDGREVAACYDVTAAGLRALAEDVNRRQHAGAR